MISLASGKAERCPYSPTCRDGLIADSIIAIISAAESLLLSDVKMLAKYAEIFPLSGLLHSILCHQGPLRLIISYALGVLWQQRESNWDFYHPQIATYSYIVAAKTLLPPCKPAVVSYLERL